MRSLSSLRTVIAILLLWFFSLGQVEAVWHESQIADHAVNSLCHHCLTAKSLKQSTVATEPFALDLLQMVEEPPLALVVVVYWVATSIHYLSRAPPAFVY